MRDPVQSPTLPRTLSRPTGHATVGWRFTSLYALSYAGGALLFLGPLLVSLALKVNDLVGIDEAPKNLALVTGVGSLLAMVSNPLFGRLSDRTTAAMGMRRPWMLTGLAGGIAGTVTVALAPNIGVVLAGWCIAQVFLNALLAAQVAVLADQVSAAQRGVVSGVLGVCLPAASVAATYLVQAFDQTDLTMFLAPCAVGALFVVLFTAKLHDRRLDPARKPAWSPRELLGSFYVNPRTSPDFAWAFVSRFMFVMAYAFLVTYQAYYLLDHIGIDEGDVPHQIYIGTLVQSAVLAITSPVAGRLSDQRRTAEGVRRDCRRYLCHRDGHRCHRLWRRRLPDRHGHQRSRLRYVHGRRPGPRRRRPATDRVSRQGPRRAEHRRCAALRPRPCPRTRSPWHDWRKLHGALPRSSGMRARRSDRDCADQTRQVTQATHSREPPCTHVVCLE